MYKAGGIIGLIAGIFGFFAAIFTLFAGGLGAAFGAKGADSVVGLGWGGIFFSFLTIVFAAVVFSKPKGAGIGLIICAVLGAILGGTAVAVCMVLAAIGGLLAVLDTSQPKLRIGGLNGIGHSQPVDESKPSQNRIKYSSANLSAPMSINQKPWLVPVLVGVLVILIIMAILGAQKDNQLKKQSNHQISNNNSQNNMGMSLDDLYAKTPDNSDGHIVSQCWQKLQWGTIAEKKKCNDDLADGKVIQWLLSVESIEQSNGNEYVVHSNAGLGVPIDIYVTSRSDEDKVFLENLKMSDGIAFKGVLNTGENSNVIIVKPAILVPMPVKPTTQIVEPSQADTTQNNSEPSLTDLKSSESVKNKGHSAFIYNPPSNVRSKPDGDVLCSITKPTDINIYDYAGSTYDGSREVKWYYTDACGSMGVIAYSQFR